MKTDRFLFGANNNGFANIFAPSSLIDTIAAPVDPKLAPLGYGGPTQTHALLPGGLDINAGDLATTTADQRGVAPVRRRDIGAHESNVMEVPVTNTPYRHP